MPDPVFSYLIDVENKFQTGFGIAGIISGVFLNLEPMTVLVRFLKEDPSLELSTTRYFLEFLNRWVAMGYAASSSNRFALVGNSVEICFLFHYTMLFMLLSPVNLMLKRVRTFILVQVVFAAHALLYYSYNESSRKLFSGSVATAFSIAINTSSLILAIKRKEVKLVSLSFYTSIWKFLNGGFWFALGLLRQDLFFVLLNGFECGVGVVQMYLIYQNNKDLKEKGKRKAKTA